MTMLNYTKIENYIYWVEQKMHNKSMEKDIKYIKAILIKLKMYGKVEIGRASCRERVYSSV